jgi:CRP/FNR family cyclic AMP-dependent transcriptional regulator
MMEFVTSTLAELMVPLGTSRGIMISIASLVGLGLIVAGSFVRTMLPLRALTVASNLFLLLSAALAPNPASILLFLVLIPINTYRLVEIHRITRKVQAASRSRDLSGIWLKPYMKPKKYKAGEVLFRKGQPADALYLLLEGTVAYPEIGKQQLPGELFGEISFFSADGARTLTARCDTDCLVLSIAGDSFRRLYFQDPSFAFEISTLITTRLSADVTRLRQALEAVERERDALAASAASEQPT